MTGLCTHLNVLSPKKIYIYNFKNKIVDLFFKCHQQQTTHKWSSLLHFVDSCISLPTIFRHPFVSNEILNGLLG
jgi:hypothetical protein